jgi:uncharacterized protein YjbI with pentapeptide repeats
MKAAVRPANASHALLTPNAAAPRSTVGNVNLAGCSFTDVNMSGATFEDANLSGWKVHDANLAGLKITKANLAGASITQGRLEGMTIDGILVSDLLAAYHASRSAEGQSE